MRKNFIFNTVNDALPELASAIMTNGQEVGSRNGRTRELCFVGVTLESPFRREIVSKARKASVVAQIAESMWLLAGRDDMDWLSLYLPRAREFSDDGKVWRGAYGARLRAWPRRDGSDDVVDQLRWLVETLKTDPSTRRATMVIFDPVKDQQPGKDIPCNNWLDFKSRLGYLDLHVALRSNDLIWGWSGINTFEWSVLLEVVAGLVGLKVGAVHFSISSLHIYSNHWDRADHIVLEGNTPRAFPELETSPRFEFPGIFGMTGDIVDGLDALVKRWFDVEQNIRLGIPEVDDLIEIFPEPMMQSWLRVLRWWWTGDEKHLAPLSGTLLHAAALSGVRPRRDAESTPRPEPTPEPESVNAHKGSTAFAREAAELHATKHAAYGDSWKRRGEAYSIIPNIARKVDRLGKTDDLETAADTALDLLIYLLKYRWWQYDEGKMGAPFSTLPAEREDEVTRVRLYLERLDLYGGWESGRDYEGELQHDLEFLINGVSQGGPVAGILGNMILQANALARREHWKAGNAKRTWKGYGDE